jgi:hypothetical protein
MRSVLLALLLIQFLSLSSCAERPVRATKPMSKGVELYSWIDSSTKNLRFVLLPGTNREKVSPEIVASPNSVSSVSELKARLALLATSEQVFWVDSKPNGYSLPSKEEIDGIINYATSINVHVHLPGQ